MKKSYLLLLSVFLASFSSVCNATVYYVNNARPDNSGAGTSWATAKKDVQNAITLATSGDEIWIKSGTYYPTEDVTGSTAPADARTKTVLMKSGVAVYGGFAGTETLLSQRNYTTNVVVFSGDLGTPGDNSDNAYHVICLDSPTALVIIDGISITLGNANNSTTVTFLGTSVTAHNLGGGIYTGNTNTTVGNPNMAVRNCKLYSNIAGGNAGAVYNRSYSAEYTNCEFTNNTAGTANGGLLLAFAGSPTFTNCVFYNNTSNGNGAAVGANITTVTITNCVFANNSSANFNGGAVFGGAAGSLITNSTFYNNSAGGATSVGAGYCMGSSGGATITNCIFYNNTTPNNSGDAGLEEINRISGSSATSTAINSCIRDAFPITNVTDGGGNFATSPAFSNAADPDGADNIFKNADDGLQLTAASPCINTGTSSGAPATDITGATRTGNPDVGAYEYATVPGAALYFDGSNDYIALPTGFPGSLSSGYTMEAWVKPTTMAAAQSVFRKTGEYNMFVYNGKLYAEIWPVTGNPAATQYAGNTTISTGTWTHCAVTWNGTTCNMYVNGVLQTNTTSALSVAGTEDLWIGRSSVFNNPFTGAMDEVRLWNRALCQSEIQNNMNCEIATTGTGLLLNMHLNSGIADGSNAGVVTAINSAGATNGTLNNFTLSGTTSNWTAPGAITTGTSCGAFSSTVTVSLASSTNVLCNGGNNGAASVSASGGTGLTYDWTPGNPSGDGTASVTGLTAGTWTCTVTNSCGGVGTQTVSITAPSALSSSVVSQTNVSCNGGSNGATTITASGGTGTKTYSWSPAPGAGQGTVSVTGLTAQVYTCTITDANSCTRTQTVSITAPAAISSSIVSQTNVSCNGGSNGAATITASGGTGTLTYAWSPAPGAGQGTVSVTGLIAQVYTCTITDANSCARTQTVSITAPAAISSSIVSQTNVSCNGGSNGAATITASGGTGTLTYAWSPAPGAGQGTVSVTGLTAQVYTCTITDANSCARTQTVSITAPSAAVSGTTVVTNVACFGGNTGAINLTPTGGTGPYTENWLPSGPTTEDRTGLVAGTYTVQITDANGCTGTVSATVGQPTAAVSGTTVVTNVACFGGNTGAINLTPTGGTPAYTFTWLPSGPTTEDRTGLVAGTYTVQITDANGCTGTVSATIGQPAAAVSGTAVVTNVSCFGGSNGAINLTPAGGTAPYTFSWTGGFTTEDITGLSAGSYTVIITDANGCTGPVSVTVGQPAAIAASISSTPTSCTSNTGTATVSGVSGGIGTFTYAWTPSGGTAAMASSLAAGVYTCTITDANGCSIAKTVTVTTASGPSASLVSSSNVSCNGNSDGSATVSASGGTGSLSYSWSPSGGTSPSATGFSAGSYTCTVTDANSCSATVIALITQPVPLVATSSATAISCNGGSSTITVSASGGTPAYLGTGTYTHTAGTYTYTVADAHGCVAATSVSITEPSLLTATSSSSAIQCNGGSTVVTVSAGGGTAAYIGTGTFTEPAGTYTYTVSDANGCVATTTVTLTEPSLLTATASATSILCNGGNSTVTVGAGGGTAAYAGTGTFTETAGTYTYTVTDANGCVATASVSITEPSVIIGSVTSTDASCNGMCDGTATATYSGGTAPYSFQWQPSGGTTSSVTGLCAGTYTLVITDNNGCTLSLTSTVNEPAAIGSSQSFTLCAGGSVTVGTNTYTTTGTYTDVLSAVGGCDSTVTTNLTVNNAIVTNQSVSLCSGQSFTVGTNTYTSTGSYTDVLTAANGCDSTVNTNLTIASQILFTQNPVVCAGGSVTVGTHTYSTNGTYTDTLTAVAGCDSIVITNLTVGAAIDTSVTINGPVATANASGAVYQWLDCNNGSVPIAGETNQSFTAPGTGNYAVVITYGACSDTSSCQPVYVEGLRTVNASLAGNVYPNPSAGLFTIELHRDATITITNALGAVVRKEEMNAGTAKIDLSNEANGVYFMQLTSKGSMQTIKLVKQD